MFDVDKRCELFNGDCLEVMKTFPDNHFHAVVTDPPYGLSKEPNIVEVMQHWINGDKYEHTSQGFMGKDWDTFVPGPEYWREVYRVMKPGAHALVFAGSRTQDLMSIALRFAGFEIRDTLMYMYGTGFPKNMDISKQMEKVSKEEAQNVQGWGTALKPAYEPIILVRKPISEKNIAENVLKFGTGAINIDESRVPIPEGDDVVEKGKARAEQPRSDFRSGNMHTDDWTDKKLIVQSGMTELGRFPANVLHDGSEEVLEEFEKYGTQKSSKYTGDKGTGGMWSGITNSPYGTTYGDSGSVSRFFYAAKASKADRDEGLESFNIKESKSSFNTKNGTDVRFDGAATPTRANNHPTVKNTSLMRYLCKLITPKNGIILDPFMGSGSTGKAAMLDGFKFIGIERDTEEGYFEIAEARIDYALNNRKPESKPTKAKKIVAPEPSGSLSAFF